MQRLLVLVVAFLVGCGSSSSGGGNASGGSGGEGGGAPVGQAGAAGWPGDGVCAGGQTAIPLADVSGKWAYLEVQSSLVQAPAYAQAFSNLVISLMLLEQTQTGTDVTGQGTFCDRYTYCPTAPTALPDALVRTLPVVPFQGSYGADGSFAFGPTYWVQGATLTDVTDPNSLPTSQDDPRVVDDDGDGMPGVTLVLVSPVAGKLYVVQWNSVRPHGASVASDRIQGLLDYDSRQVVLASDPATIKSMSPTTTVDPEACHSTFQMVRVAADMDCATLKAQEVTLFPDLAATPRTNP
jgi:hypothetical protein